MTAPFVGRLRCRVEQINGSSVGYTKYALHVDLASLLLEKNESMHA